MPSERLRFLSTFSNALEDSCIIRDAYEKINLDLKALNVSLQSTKSAGDVDIVYSLSKIDISLKKVKINIDDVQGRLNLITSKVGTDVIKSPMLHQNAALVSTLEEVLVISQKIEENSQSLKDLVLELEIINKKIHNTH